jgi:hypothetical protein
MSPKGLPFDKKVLWPFLRWSNSTQLSIDWEGQIVPRAFSPGFVRYHTWLATSVHGQRWNSSIGGLRLEDCTIGISSVLKVLEDHYAGKRTRYLLIGSSISMRGIAIWCMHYIGNRAIIVAYLFTN